MFITYIIYSERLESYYTGSTDNLAARLNRHNTNGSRFTARGMPWVIIYQKRFFERMEAVVHEKRIKKLGAKSFLKALASAELADGSKGPQAPASRMGGQT